MINLIYDVYPYRIGSAEAFAEYELRALPKAHGGEAVLYSFCTKDTEKRYVPEGYPVYRVFESKRLKTQVKAFFRFFEKDSIAEVLYVLKKPPKEGLLRSIHRIYRYLYAGEAFKSRIKAGDGKNIFVSYWLNECAYAALAAKEMLPDAVCVSRGHGFDIFEERCYMPFRRKILTGLDRVFVINRAAYDYLHETYAWLDMSKVQIKHLGIDLPPHGREVKLTRPMHIVTCSSVIPLKRLDLMADALVLLSDASDAPVKWTHIGDGPLKSELEQRVSEGLTGSSVTVDFVGQKTLSEIYAFYAKTDIHLFVNCSDTEGTPVSIMEAMSYGIPCIARNVGGISEVVGEDCGVLLPAEGDPKALAEAILQMMNLSEEVYQRMRRAARHRIETDFNAEINYPDYVNTLQELI